MATDYFTELQPMVHDKLKPLAGRRDTLILQRAAIRKKTEDTSGLIERLQRHGEDLGQRAGASLLGGQNEYARFQTSLRKNVVDIETAQRELVALQTALERTENDFALAERALTGEIKNLARLHLPLAQRRIGALVEQLCGEFDAWVVGWDKLAGQYNESFSADRLDYMPGIRHPRIDPGLPNLIKLLSPEQRAERLKQAGEAGR